MLQTATVTKASRRLAGDDTPFHNVVLARISRNLSHEQALGYHMLMRDRELASGRSGCTLSKIGQPSSKSHSGAVNLYWNSHQEAFDAVRQKLRAHERNVLSWILSHADHKSSPDLVAAGKLWTGYTDPSRASAAAVAIIKCLGSSLAEIYRIRRPPEP